jgi:NlpC/P60 family putative phage cell wall peptidase
MLMLTHNLTRTAIVAEARGWIGTPYRHQASCKGVGCDCLGLVRGVWRAVIGPEPETTPPYAADWAEASAKEALAEAALRHMVAIDCNAFAPGDVLLFRWRAGFIAKHAAIVTCCACPDRKTGSHPGSSPGQAFSGTCVPNRMVHAHDGAAVAEVAIAPWWRRRLAYAFRFPGVTD